MEDGFEGLGSNSRDLLFALVELSIVAVLATGLSNVAGSLKKTFAVEFEGGRTCTLI